MTLRPDWLLSVLLALAACSSSARDTAASGGAASLAEGGSSAGSAAAAAAAAAAPAAGLPMAGGSAGSAAGASGGGMASVEVGASVLERNADAARTAHFVRPGLDRESVKHFFFERTFQAGFDGDVAASPLYFERGPDGRGVVFVVTLGSDIHAIDAASGAEVWTRHIGGAVIANGPSAPGVACSSGRLGIASTPIIDPLGRTLYLAAAVGQARVERHEIHALSIDDGSERPGFPVDVAQLANTLPAPGAFDVAAHFQQSALSLVNGVLYVAYGAHAPCEGSRGWVFAIDTRLPGASGCWRARAAGGGIDAHAGMASDGEGLFVATGTGSAAVTIPDDAQRLFRLRGLGDSATDPRDFFTPQSWQQMNQSGASLGASNPLLIDLAGRKYVAVVAGDGHLYLLDPKSLGGVGGQQLDFPIATGFSSAIRTAPTTYRTERATYLALTASSGVSCPIGSPAPPVGNTGQVVVSLRLGPGAPPSAEVAWCYFLITGQGAPISTSTDGSSDATVWFMDDVKLLGLDGDTGQVLFDGGHDISGVPFAERTCPDVAPYTSPIPVGARLMIAGKNRLCAWAKQD